MSQRWWYLRRAVPWTALLGCCAAAVVVSLLLERWPSSAMVLLPALVASCAAGAAFVFDEATIAVVEVTPRGATWRRVARLAVAGVPLLVWTAAVWAAPGDLALDRGTWWVVGAAAVVLGVGAAAAASRRSVPMPGAALAPILVLGLFAPLVITMFLGWEPVYPVDGFTDSSGRFWTAVAVAGLLACAAALRPSPRR